MPTLYVNRVLIPLSNEYLGDQTYIKSTWKEVGVHKSCTFPMDPLINCVARSVGGSEHLC